MRIERDGTLTFVEDDPYCAWSFAIDGEDITEALAKLLNVHLGPYATPTARVPERGESFGRWRVTLVRMECPRCPRDTRCPPCIHPEEKQP